MPSPLLNPITRGQLADVARNALISWHKGAEMAQDKIMGVRNLFWEKAADGYTEEHSSFVESGFSKKTGEGEDYALVTDTQGDTMTLTQIKRSVRRVITEDLIKFNKYPEIDRKLRNVGGKLWRGYALDLTHRFTFAFDTSYTDRDGESVTTTGGDTAAMCANTHTMNDGSTFDNLLSGRLSESTLEDAEDLGVAVVDHNGELVTPDYNLLITGPQGATKHVAQRLIGQPMQLDTDQHNMSVYQGKYQHVILPYLDTTAVGAKNTAKSRFWFIVDSNLMKNDGNLAVAVAEYPDPEAPTKDPDNNNLTFKAKMWYDIALLDSSCIVGSNAV